MLSHLGILSKVSPHPSSVAVTPDLSHLFPQTTALIVAFVVLALGTATANSRVFSQIVTTAQIGILETASGFKATFGEIPHRVLANVNTASMILHSHTASVPEQIPFMSDTNPISPLLDLTQVAAPLALAEFSTTVFAPPIVPSRPISATISQSFVATSLVHLGSEITTFGTYAQRVSFRTYVSAGEGFYFVIVRSGTTYQTIISRISDQALVIGAQSITLFVQLPPTIHRVNMALGEGVITATHYSIAFEVRGVYSLVRAAPQVARVTFEATRRVGNTLARASARVPAVASAFARGAP